MSMDALHQHIADALGWNVEDVRKFSAQTIREPLRVSHPKLAHLCDEAIRSGSYIIGDDLKKKKRS